MHRNTMSQEYNLGELEAISEGQKSFIQRMEKITCPKGMWGIVLIYRWEE